MYLKLGDISRMQLTTQETRIITPVTKRPHRFLDSFTAQQPMQSVVQKHTPPDARNAFEAHTGDWTSEHLNVQSDEHVQKQSRATPASWDSNPRLLTSHRTAALSSITNRRLSSHLCIHYAPHIPQPCANSRVNIHLRVSTAENATQNHMENQVKL